MTYALLHEYDKHRYSRRVRVREKKRERIFPVFLIISNLYLLIIEILS